MDVINGAKGNILLSSIQGKLCNFSATTDPAVGDDSADGYSIGSIWVNNSTKDVFRCTDATAGAAVWVDFLTLPTSGASEFPITDFSIKQTASTIDITDSANTSGYRDKIASKFTDWNGSGNAFVKEGETELVVGQKYFSVFYLSDESAKEVYFYGAIFITEIGVEVPVVGDDVVKRSLSFEGSGGLTKVDNN